MHCYDSNSDDHSTSQVRTGHAWKAGGCMKVGQHLSGANFPVQVHDAHTTVQSQEAGAAAVMFLEWAMDHQAPQSTPQPFSETLHQNITHAHSIASHMKNLLPRRRSRHSQCQLECEQPDECFVLWTPTPNRSGLWRSLWPQTSKFNDQILLLDPQIPFLSAIYYPLSFPSLSFLFLIYFFHELNNQNGHILSTAIT